MVVAVLLPDPGPPTSNHRSLDPLDDVEPLRGVGLVASSVVARSPQTFWMTQAGSTPRRSHSPRTVTLRSTKTVASSIVASALAPPSTRRARASWTICNASHWTRRASRRGGLDSSPFSGGMGSFDMARAPMPPCHNTVNQVVTTRVPAPWSSHRRSVLETEIAASRSPRLDQAAQLLPPPSPRPGSRSLPAAAVASSCTPRPASALKSRRRVASPPIHRRNRGITPSFLPSTPGARLCLCPRANFSSTEAAGIGAMRGSGARSSPQKTNRSATAAAAASGTAKKIAVAALGFRSIKCPQRLVACFMAVR